ncbi:MAG: TIM barrel protein, partial [Deltaproteobacteria bacterium]|nr:TIM barrel protein [Deltaproteobacteria bacterium]
MKMHRIRIGTQTAFSAATILAPFEYAVANGFDAFEWLPDKTASGVGWEQRDLDAQTRRRIKETAFEHDIRQSVHAPWQLNPTDPTFEQRFPETIEFSQDLNASLINIHLYLDQGIDAYIQGILRFVKTLTDAGITLTIENTPLTGPQDFNLFFERLRDLAPGRASQVGMCLDIGHANLCEATRNDYLRFIDLIAPEVPIVHLHLHENYGDADTHLTVFTGPSQKDESGITGVVARMKQRGFSGSVILEQWPDPPELLNQARDRLRVLFDIPPPSDDHVFDIQENDPVRVITHANQQNPSWRQRLAWIRDLLVSQGPEIDMDLLAYLAVYLRLIGTGQIPCREDGGHYRPSHHAAIARDIFEHLSRVKNAQNALIIRKIYPWLPSFSPAFTRAEPLTRIRDIAHRNDIPKPLKREIKHSLQNKLHRCAGPEDLATSAALLKKITDSKAHYSKAFVESYKIFHAQLEEFFNAAGLDRQLEAIVRSGKEHPEGRHDSWFDTVERIRVFLKTKKTSKTQSGLIRSYEQLTDLRVRFHDMLPSATNEWAHRLLVTDIALEDFSFAILGQLLNPLEKKTKHPPWSHILHILQLTVRNLELSDVDEKECRAIASELEAWEKELKAKRPSRLLFLRIKATVDRCRRLSDRYADRILGDFALKVETLGSALG